MWDTRSRRWRLLPLVMLLGGCVDGDALSPEAMPAPPAARASLSVDPALRDECAASRPEWIWCDDFEQDRLGGYFEYESRSGSFARASGVGVEGSSAMRARFEAGQTNAGNLKLAFGRTPSPYMRPVDAGTADHREIYWRVFLRNEAQWTGGGGDKLSRAVVFAQADWSEAMVAHVWSGGPGSNHLVIDPNSGTDAAGNLRTSGYNDFDDFRWLGAQTSVTPLFAPGEVGEWRCVETHVRLNDPGQGNGVFELWIDGASEAAATGLNWLGAYDAYGINALFLENYWNAGSPRAQERYFDNLVVSTERIGCEAPPVSTAPRDLALRPEGASTLRLDWSRGGEYDGQFIERKYTSPDGTYTDPDWIRVRTLAGSTTSLVDAGLQVGATYSYRVVALLDGAETEPSNVAQAVVGSAPEDPEPPEAPVAAVTVAPSSVSLLVDATAQLTATPQDSEGGTLSGRTVAWASSDPDVAAVGPSGLVTTHSAGSATITATSEGKSGSATVTVTQPPAPVATVTVSPASVSLQVGATRQLAAALRDAQGEPLSGRSVSWTSSNPGVASVSASGLVTGRAAGSATVTATSEGRSGTAAVQVQAPSGSVAPWFEVNFEQYSSTSALLNDCTTWVCYEDAGRQNIQLDDVGYSAGGLTKSMRFDFLHSGNGCTSISNTRQIPLPSPRQEVWAEFVIRWSENFRTTNDACAPNDHKLIFGHTQASNTGRWAFYVGADTGPDHTLMVERPGLPLRGAYYPSQSAGMVPTDLWDGEWHVIRLHLKHSTGNSGGDGILRVWVDGQLIHSETTLNTPTSSGAQDLIRALSLGRNKDDGPAGELMSLWWSRVRVWNASPGW